MSNISKASGMSDFTIKRLQKSVPDEARSVESSEIVYVDEPSPRLDGEWNLGMKLCTQYRYTEEYAKKWREKYKFLPAAEELTDSDFFSSLNLKFDKPNLLSYFCNRKKQSLPKIDLIYGKSEEQIIKSAESLPEDNTRSLMSLLPYYEQAYYCSNNSKYLNEWLRIFNTWYHKSRPPAQKPLVYIGFIWNPDWNTLSSAGRFYSLIRMENVLSSDKGIEIDTDSRINLYKSILEHARYLYLVNETFQPSNWQTHQMCTLLQASIIFPEFKESPAWIKTAWQRLLEHMRRETFPDGGHNERSTGYNLGVIDHYRKAVKYAEEAQIKIPGWFMDKFESMYVWIMNLLLPEFSLPNIGDGGWLAGKRVFYALSYAALKFADPNFKWFVMNEPEKVKKTAEDFFTSPDEAIKRYNSVSAEKPDYTSVLLPDTGWAVMRSSWESDASALVIDFGSNEPFHTHADFGSFSLYGFGKPLICDCGHAGAYEDDRSKLWYKRTIAHNTVMVDTQSQWRAMHGECRKWVSLSNFDYIDTFNSGYKTIGMYHWRRVLFIKPHFWILTDYLNRGEQVVGSGYHEYDWLAHFLETELQIDFKTKRINTLNNGANICITPMNPDDITAVQSKGPAVTPKGEMDDMPYITLHQEHMPPAYFGNVLFPYRNKEKPEIKIEALDTEYRQDYTARPSRGHKIRITDREYYYLESDPVIKENIQYGDILFKGEIAFLEKRYKQIFMVNCCLLKQGDLLLFENSDIVDSIQIQFEEDTVNIESKGLKKAVLYAPGIKKLILNGKQTVFKKQGMHIHFEA